MAGIARRAEVGKPAIYRRWLRRRRCSDGAEQGYIEVDTNLDDGSRTSRVGALADAGNLWVDPACRRRGVGTWLLGQAATWLELGGVTRLLDYADAGDEAYQGFLTAAGFTVLTRTVRGAGR